MPTIRSSTLGFLARHRADRLEPITERLVDTIEQSNPGYRSMAVVPRADLWRSCHDNVDRVLELLSAAVREHGVLTDGSHYDAARETGRRRAEQGLPLDDVLRSYRIGGRLIWDDLIAQGEAALDAAAVREIGTRLWEVVDETSAQVAIAYHLHERSLVRADEQQRAELWEGLLSGRAREPGFAHEAAGLLDIPVSADLLVVAGRGLDLRAAEVRLAPHSSAWVRRSGEVVGLLALREDDPRPALRALHETALHDDAVLGVSSAVAGLALVHDGYQQATLALRAQGHTVGAAGFDERLPEALLLGSPGVAARLVSRWLGPVLALPRAESEALLDTLAAWVAAGGSSTRTAAAVPCHRNTVLNRLRRVGALVGHRFDDGEVPVGLDLALRWRRLDPPT